MSIETMTWEQAVLWLRGQPGQEDLVQACFYDDPLIDAARRYHACDEWQAVREFLPGAKGRALDLGAGRGISSFALAREGWKVTALEPDPSAVVGAAAIGSLAATSGLDIEVVQEWGETLPFGDASFDLVFCRQALHHARGLGRFCAEAGRVLRPGGRFIATREHVISRREDLPAFLESHPLHRLYGGESAYLLEEYRNAIRSAGIQLDRVLNPFASAINLYPQTAADAKRQVAQRLRLPFPSAIPDFALAWAGHFVRSPGRLYSFIGTRATRE